MSKDSNKDDRRPERLPYRFRYPGYFLCKRKLERLRIFQNLIRHKARWAREYQFASPLEKLMPDVTDPAKIHVELDHMLNRLIPHVAADLSVAGVRLWVTHSEEEIRYNEQGELIRQDVERRYHLIADCDQLLRHAENSHLLMAALEQGIGVYQERQRSAWWEVFNPVI